MRKRQGLKNTIISERHGLSEHWWAAGSFTTAIDAEAWIGGSI
jgi:hypothetical protein